jgi:hypothetical protein
MSAMRGAPPDAQMLSLQQEALRRVRDMQARAQRTVEQANARQTALDSPPPAPAFAAPPGAQGRPPGGPATGQAHHRPVSPGAPGVSPGRTGNPGAFPNRPGPQQGFSQGAPNILSHLFGGGPARRTVGAQAPAGGPAAASGAGYSRSAGQSSRPAGLLNLLRTRGVADSFGGLGETLHNTISSVSEPLSGLLDTLGIDGETLIILLVMWVIFNERGDKTLLLALGYLLL